MKGVTPPRRTVAHRWDSVCGQPSKKILTDYKQLYKSTYKLGQPESFPWEPGPPGAAPPSACMRLHLCSQAPPTPAVIYLWISGVQCKVASVLSDSL